MLPASYKDEQLKHILMNLSSIREHNETEMKPVILSYHNNDTEG